ncbi:MAG: hypothetical protein H6597_06580 [Flavobacteriales bacterium]|nr:hypothetical protein [Flavobacteriales bacterium]MCB9194182.1 hypothetical protein [Flavobacteriales bacterium]
MAPRSSLMLLLSVLTGAVHAQLFQNYMIAPGGGTRAIVPFADNGGLIFACDRAFGYDSSRVDLLWTSADMTVLDAVSYRLLTPLNFFADVARVNDGFVISGGAYSSLGTTPTLLKLDDAGTVEWYLDMTDLQHGHDQLLCLVPRGSAFTSYSTDGGSFSEAVYRIEANTDGTGWSGIDIGAPADFRFYHAIPTADPMVQLLTGAGTPTATPGNMQAMLMKTDANGAVWLKRYDLNGTNTEDLYDIIPTNDGNYLCTGYRTVGNTFDAVVMKVDPDGEVLWCRTYADVSGGCFLSKAFAMDDGSFLVSGSNAGYVGLLARIDASGDVLWTKRYDADRFNGFHFLNGQLLAMGLHSVVQLDANGEGCDLVDNDPLTATTQNVTAAVVAVTNTPFMPNVVALPAHVRDPELSWTPGCVWSGVAEPAPTGQTWTISPNPTEGAITVGADGAAGASYRVLSMTGRVVGQGTYRGAIDLGALPAGAYVLDWPEQGRRFPILRR